MTTPKWMHGNTFDDPGETLAALTNKLVRSILAELAEHGERTPTHLKDACPGVTKSMVTQHLAFLTNAGVTTYRPEGTRRFYRLVPGGLDAPIALLRQVIGHLDNWDAASHTGDAS